MSRRIARSFAVLTLTTLLAPGGAAASSIQGQADLQIDGCTTDNPGVGEAGCQSVLGQLAILLFDVDPSQFSFTGSQSLFGVGTRYDFEAPAGNTATFQVPFGSPPGPQVLAGNGAVFVQASDFDDNSGSLIDQVLLNVAFGASSLFPLGGALELSVLVGEFDTATTDALQALAPPTGGLGGLLGGLLGGSGAAPTLPLPPPSGGLGGLLGGLLGGSGSAGLFGSTTSLSGTLTGYAVAVPEPTRAALLALAGACLTTLARRQDGGARPRRAR